MPGQCRSERCAALPKVGTRALIGVLADAAAAGIAEDIGEEKLRIRSVGLELDDVEVSEFVGISRKTGLHSRVNQRAKRLRQHHRQSAGKERAMRLGAWRQRGGVVR